jgi:hypothetical protein
MGRPRRFITDDGKLFCPLCEQWVDIEGYSTRRLLGGGEDFIEDIWFERNGRNFGKPQGYCRPCMTAASQGQAAKQARKEKVKAELEGKGEVVVQPHIMSFREEMDAMVAAMPQEALEAESERLRRLYGDPR